MIPVALAGVGVVVAWALGGCRSMDLRGAAREAVFAELRDGLFVLDAQGRIADLNRTAERILGRSAADARGRLASELFTGLLQPLLHVVTAPEAPVEIDPSWSHNLAESIGRTEVDIVAVAAGPPMLLGDVAALQPGSVVEFDADQLEHVRIESEGEAIFEGQLGQQKGFFSICLETPVAAKPDEAKGPPGRRRA